MKSILSFKRYDVLETVYKFNPINNLEAEEVIPEFNLKINYKDIEKTEAILIFSIELGDEKLENNSFYIRATISGLFSLEIEEIDSSLDDKEKFIKDMYCKNALAILFPYMRSLVSDLSSKGSEPAPILLPPINISAVIDEIMLTERIIEKE